MEFESLDFSRARVLVVGDVMLDQYWHGQTNRISPEAPVPVVHLSQVTDSPGGAANVALNLAALGSKVSLLGLIGKDLAAQRLTHLLEEAGVQAELVKLDDFHTITKLRVMSRNQQLIRLDTESTHALNFNDTLFAAYLKKLTVVDAVILADYNKGTLTHPESFIEAARAAGIPVLVDPKRINFAAYKGASIITPNLKEFEAVVGHCANLSELEEKAKALLFQQEIESIIITRAEQGISVISADGLIDHIPARAREVFDVTGAGDTVIAVIGAAIASGLSLDRAARLGNVAGGIVVGKLGTATVTVPELSAALGINTTFQTGILSEDAVLNAIRTAKAQGERIVFTNGCFDILHAGHVMYLEEAKRLGDRVVIAVNDDASVRRLKGSERPINTVEDRMTVLAGLRSVDWVLSFSEDTPERIIRKISPHTLVKGGDYQKIEELPGAKYVLSQGAKVQILSLKEGCSTTKTINAIVGQTRERSVLEE